MSQTASSPDGGGGGGGGGGEAGGGGGGGGEGEGGHVGDGGGKGEKSCCCCCRCCAKRLLPPSCAGGGVGSGGREPTAGPAWLVLVSDRCGGKRVSMDRSAVVALDSSRSLLMASGGGCSGVSNAVPPKLAGGEQMQPSCNPTAEIE